MKKIIFSVVVLSLLIPVPVFAEETITKEMPGMFMNKPGEMPTMPMPGMGPGPMQMVAANEGGVIVLAYGRLMKYDADLNLVKEVHLKVPMGPMGDMQIPREGTVDQAIASAVEESQEKPL